MHRNERNNCKTQKHLKNGEMKRERGIEIMCNFCVSIANFSNFNFVFSFLNAIKYYKIYAMLCCAMRTCQLASTTLKRLRLCW